MLTRRREENSTEVTSLSSPKRIRVGESDHESQYPTCFSTLSSSHTYTISTIAPVEAVNFSNQEDLTKSSDHSANHNHATTEETILLCQTSARTVQVSLEALEASNQNLVTKEYAIIERTLNSIISQPEIGRASCRK